MTTHMRIRGRRHAKLKDDQLALAFLLLAKSMAEQSSGEIQPNSDKAVRKAA